MACARSTVTSRPSPASTSTIERGEVFALLGPNGAGKTTTVEILEGYRRRSGGEVAVLGLDPETGGRALRERIGIVLQEAELGPDLTVRETIELYSAAYPASAPVDEVVRAGRAGRASATRASGRSPEASGAASTSRWRSPATRSSSSSTSRPPASTRPPAGSAWELVENLRSLGKTILLTTHYMDEAQSLADRVAVHRARPDRRRGPSRVARRPGARRRRSSASGSPRSRPRRAPAAGDAELDIGDGVVSSARRIPRAR